MYMVSYHLIPQNLAVPRLGTVLRDEENVKWFVDLEQFRLIFLIPRLKSILIISMLCLLFLLVCFLLLAAFCFVALPCY